MAVSLSPFAGAGWQFFDNNGVILSGGKLYVYAAGTTSSATTYTSSTGSTANTNPIILDSAGRVPYEIWLTLGLDYKFILKTSTDTLISTWDYIPSSLPNILYEYSSGTFTPTLGGVTTGGTYTYTTQQGNYTKLNNVVTFSIYLVVSGITTAATGNIVINGLPAASNSALTKQSVYIGDWSNITLPTSRVNLAGYIAASSTSISLVGTATALASSAVQPAGLSASTVIAVSGSYKV